MTRITQSNVFIRLLTALALSLIGTFAQGMDASTCANLIAVSHTGFKLTQAGAIDAGKFVPEEGFYWEEDGGYASKEGLDKLPSFCRLKGAFDAKGFAFEIWIPLDGWNGRRYVSHGCCAQAQLARIAQGAALVWTKTVDPESARSGGGDRRIRDVLDLLENIRGSLGATP